MNAVYAALLQPVGALFLAEAGGIARQRLRQRLFRDDLINEFADHGVLGCADEIEILPFDLVHHGFHIRLAHNALDHLAVDHKRRNAVSEALIDHKISRIGQHGGVQAGDVAHQIVKSVAGDSASGIHIYPIELFHDLSMVRNLKIRHFRLAEALHFHVAAVVRTDRDRRIDDIRNLQHDGMNFFRQFLFLLLQLRKPLLFGAHFCHVCVNFCLNGGFFLFRGLFEFAEKGPVRLAQAVFLCTQVAGLADGSTVFRIQLQHFIHKRQLCVLKFLSDVFLHYIRIVSNKLNV